VIETEPVTDIVDSLGQKVIQVQCTGCISGNLRYRSHLIRPPCGYLFRFTELGDILNNCQNAGCITTRIAQRDLGLHGPGEVTIGCMIFFLDTNAGQVLFHHSQVFFNVWSGCFFAYKEHLSLAHNFLGFLTKFCCIRITDPDEIPVLVFEIHLLRDVFQENIQHVSFLVIRTKGMSHLCQQLGIAN